MAQKADFEIQNFRESITDLSAATSDIKDLNGQPAALIRFTVRDTIFTINANNGILKQEQKTGETWVYVPVGTKRLNISHPVLGIIRGYQIGIAIESKCTYDADIVITNDKYMESLFANDRIAFTEQDRSKDIIPASPLKEKESKKSNRHIKHKTGQEVKKKDDEKAQEYKLVRQSDDMYFAKVKENELEMYNKKTKTKKEKIQKDKNKKEKKQTQPNKVKKDYDDSYNYFKTFTVNGVTFRMIRVDGGTFMMGTESKQYIDVDRDQLPTHRVTLSTYYIGETEVTQELWQAVMGSNPSYFKGMQKPVEQVSWNDCQDFISRLVALTGLNFRLPTEAEWEFAARGGKKNRGRINAGSDFIDDIAWYGQNSGNETHEVATKGSNELGLYDMSGNVWEWCQDWYGSYNNSSQANPTGPAIGDSRVDRGGSWRFDSKCCRVSFRGNMSSDYRGDIGLRLAL